MKKTPRFLLCQNPLIEEKHLFILSTRRGELLMKVVDHPDKTFNLEIEKVYSATDQEIQWALNDATKWYISARHA